MSHSSIKSQLNFIQAVLNHKDAWTDIVSIFQPLMIERCCSCYCYDY